MLATLAAYILMIQVIKRGEARRTGAVPDLASGGEGDEEDERLRGVIAHTALPFLIFYGAWGLFTEDVRQYSVLAQELGGVQQMYNLKFDPLLVATLYGAARMTAVRRPAPSRRRQPDEVRRIVQADLHPQADRARRHHEAAVPCGAGPERRVGNSLTAWCRDLYHYVARSDAL
ncbi:hypothetical protein [Spongiactinospora sp. TRM90649]|uniref:hypothetical protein n=1 Tax=Spongiactinospora sp. TRM90649 TaxID=3031114 RepID=UPI0023F77739|nr:hypothetical protein [Spongiactinospora sp. TRM90649]MDF5756950.1 hypothetical protein [Spongiactinospora sp. TRM90649]